MDTFSNGSNWNKDLRESNPEKVIYLKYLFLELFEFKKASITTW